MNLYGLRASEIEQIKQILEQHVAVESAILYGSRAKGNYKPASDIDLTLTGRKLNLETLQKIEAELDDLLLPYKCDLSILHKITNPDLLAHIERIGKVFYSQNDIV